MRSQRGCAKNNRMASYPCWTAARTGGVPTCRRRRNATSTGWGWRWGTCSTTRWRCCTIRPTGRPTPERCAWNGRASRCPVGPMATAPGPPARWSPLPPGAGSLAALLDPETPVPGVTAGTLRPELAAVAVPSTVGGGNMDGDDFALTAGWGHLGVGDAVMPGTGRAVERKYAAAEREAMGNAVDILGGATVDVHLNGNAKWSNVPATVWEYKLGGYQVLKKWLSYREHKVLGRNLRPKEVRHFTDTARRIAAILLLTAAQ